MIDYAEPQRGIFTLSLLEPAACEEIVARAQEKGVWEQAEIIESTGEGEGHVIPEMRQASLVFFDKDTPVGHLFDEKIETRVRPLLKTRWKRDYPEYETLQVVRYDPGDFFVAHRDSGPHTERRYFSVVCYLNDTFEGGGTYFPNKDYTVVPQQGNAVIFPSNYLHQGQHVRQGTKYIAVTWLLGPPPVSSEAWFT